jgi:hypothetical protein
MWGGIITMNRMRMLSNALNDKFDRAQINYVITEVLPSILDKGVYNIFIDEYNWYNGTSYTKIGTAQNTKASLLNILNILNEYLSSTSKNLAEFYTYKILIDLEFLDIDTVISHYYETTTPSNCNARLTLLYTIRDTVISPAIDDDIVNGRDTSINESYYDYIVNVIDTLIRFRNNNDCLIEGDEGYDL